MQTDIAVKTWRFWRRRPNQPAVPDETPRAILASYSKPPGKWGRRLLGLSLLMLFCLIYGFAFAVMAPYYIVSLLVPLIALAFLVVWVLPDTIPAPIKTLRWFFWAFFISLIIWPNYLAVAIPGLPWITFQRLTAFPLCFLLLVCLSVSADFRARMMHSLRTVQSIPILLAIFVVIQIVSIAMSADPSFSIQKFIVAQTTWTAMFFAGAYVFLRPGSILRFAQLLWAMAIVVSIIAIWEYRIGHVPWAGHIPSFLKIQDESVLRTLAGGSRAGTGRYRAEATFSTSLGLAEYLALAIPFMMHFTSQEFSKLTRAAAILSIPLILYASFLTDAKLGTVGSFAAVLIYIFVAAYQAMQRKNSSVFAAAIVYGYPFLFAGTIGVMLSVHRFKIAILGDGSHANSTAARVSQYTTGFGKFLERPFGYGIGMGAGALGFGQDIGGMLTIDTYYLSILLEYGIAGFVVFYGMFAIAIYEASRRGLRIVQATKDKSFLMPIALSLIVFIIIKSVFSQQDNHPMVFMMLGAVLAIIAQRKNVKSA